ncbi:MAG: ABC transporter substrate-binding protein [Chloroflexi bacterium]|nr:ABC transporter substrate-binding protein [Chloroflexota bacterium]
MKICSLLPSGTEILYALGLGDQIVGVTDLCDFPPEVKEKPIVCRSRIDVDSMTSQQVEAMMRQILAAGESPYELDGEWLATNSPDVVLTQDLCYFCEVDAQTVGRTVDLMPMPPEVVVLQPRTLRGILDSILQVGNACNTSFRAEKLVAALEKRRNTIEERLDGLSQRPRVFSLEGINPLVIGGHWIPDLLRRAGGQLDLFEPGSPATRIEWQLVTEYEPEKLFIDLCSSDLRRQRAEVSWLASQAGWKDIPAVRSGEVYLIDHVYFSVPGPRIIKGLEILAQLTHPDKFAGLIPPETVLKLDATKAAMSAPEDIGDCFLPWPGGGLQVDR